MDWTHVKPSDGRLTPWKNGGGTTLELAVDPPGASLATGFRWRLSTAEVGASGPFSAFPGVERWLFLLAGAGFRVSFSGQGGVDITEPLHPIRFSGDWPATATLVNGPCTDLNLMVDPECCHASVETLTLTGPRVLEPASTTTLLFVARGTASAADWNLHLGPRHLLRLEGGEGRVSLVPGWGGATVIRMNLERL